MSSYPDYLEDAAYILRSYIQLETELIQLSGYNLRGLRKLFAEGYTLKAPDKAGLMEELAKELDDGRMD